MVLTAEADEVAQAGVVGYAAAEELVQVAQCHCRERHIGLKICPVAWTEPETATNITG